MIDEQRIEVKEVTETQVPAQMVSEKWVENGVLDFCGFSERL